MHQDQIRRLLQEVEMYVTADSYNLTRDDQTSISIEIERLRSFIAEKYAQHKTMSEKTESVNQAYLTSWHL